MKWTDETTGKPVVRMLSFQKKSEDGDIIPVTSPSSCIGYCHFQEHDKLSSELGSAKSITSTDLKKLRRSSSSLKTPPSPVAKIRKTSSFSVNGKEQSGDPDAYPLKYLKTNRLILRVPSACEYDRAGVFHATSRYPLREDSYFGKDVNDGPEGCVTKNSVIEIANRDGLSVSILSKSESTTNLIPVTPKVKQKYRHRNFMNENLGKQTADVGLDAEGNWRIAVTNHSFGSSVTGSTSLSTFSLGDGFSTASRMGSTNRLVYDAKTKKEFSRSWSEELSNSLSVLSLAGTLGNLIRLPRMVYFHGGGVFLLVYTLITLLFGIPLIFLEIGLGQFCQDGIIKLWRSVNLFRGVGYAKVFICTLTSMYYVMYMAVALPLLVWSIKELPFSACDFKNMGETNPEGLSGEQCLKATFLAPASQDAFWFGIDVFSLLLLWILIFILVGFVKRSDLKRRIHSLILVLLVATLVALICEAATRSNVGISKLWTFHWASLFNVQVWYFSFVQMFFSLQIGFGTINTCAGSLYPKSNPIRSAVTVVVFNLLIGIGSVSLIYLWIGQLEEAGIQIPVQEVPEFFVLSLVYSVGTHCIEMYSPAWAALAYYLVIIAGLASSVVLVYTISVAISNEMKGKWQWFPITALLCFGTFIVGMSAMIPDYFSILHILDHYVVSRTVVALTFAELIGLAYIYGCKNIYNDLEFVIGQRLSNYWKTIWCATPGVLVIIEVCSAVFLPLEGEAPAQDETWKYLLGWIVYFFVWIIITLCACYQVYIQVDYNIAQKFVSAIKPSRNWGPVDPIYRHCWVQWRNRYHMTGQRDFTLKRRGTRDYTHSVRKATEIGSTLDISRVNSSLDWTLPRSASHQFTLERKE